MKPRISEFGKIYWKDLLDYLTENYVFGQIVKVNNDNTLTYKCVIMFRNHYRGPEELFIKVSSSSKLVLSANTQKLRFKNIDELKKYCKR